MSGPLDHLVVVELAQSMPAAIAAMMLADHGADVVKVEPRGGAFFAHDLTRKSWDRSKRSVELDIELGNRSAGQPSGCAAEQLGNRLACGWGSLMSKLITIFSQRSPSL